mmetsp:Transcript_103206/g.291429  ORF Transcript_103206/g.291429 Transcript_103206/m.291429 type:complete len:191 (+) Transcript_103206:79-651(+)
MQREKPPVALENQPRWARKLIAGTATVDIGSKGAGGIRPLAPIQSREDILTLLGQGGGAGLVVDEAIVAAYPNAARDVMDLIQSGMVRHVKIDRRLSTVSGNVGAGKEKSTPEAEAVLGVVLFVRFEPEVEALRVEDDIREAYHAAPRPQAGDVRPVLLPPPPEPGPKKRARRASTSSKKTKNVHMQPVT